MALDVNTLDDYLKRYGRLLGEHADAKLRPLHRPGIDPLPDLEEFLRKPFPAQAHVATGSARCLSLNRGTIVNAQMGTGKTYMAAVIAHLKERAKRKGYRVLVMCPGHLIGKWAREILETVPDAAVTHIEHSYQLNAMRRTWCDPLGAEWFLIGRETAKLSPQWRPAVISWEHMRGKRWPEGYYCPGCHQLLRGKEDNPLKWEDLTKSKRKCKNLVTRLVRVPADDAKDADRWTFREEAGHCDAPLYTYFGPQQKGVARFQAARYIKKRMPGFFDVFVLDEAHEEKSADSAQGTASGMLMAACDKSIILTGTLIGGYAEDVRPLLWRLAPRTLVAEGLTWEDEMEFTKRYGRVERIVTEVDEVKSHSHSVGKSRTTTRTVARPGIMPTLFGRHLLGITSYLSLSEVSEALPSMHEFIVPVDLNQEQAEEYTRLEEVLDEANRSLVRMGSKALLGAMLSCLLAWPDYPYDWPWVGYSSRRSGWVDVVEPKSLSKLKVWPKEEKLIEIAKKERAEGRQLWVYVEYTDTHDVHSRLIEILNDAGVATIGMRQNVPVLAREEWIAKHGPQADVIVSHPQLVQTGLDLFDKGGRHNFASIMFYETGYQTIRLRQAGARGLRIGQTEECRLYYLFYTGTMQERAMTFMGRKVRASKELEGDFDINGLAALADDDASMEMALAKSINSVIKGDGARAWEQIGEVATGPFRAGAHSARALAADLADLEGLEAAFGDDDEFDNDIDDLVELDELMDSLEDV